MSIPPAAPPVLVVLVAFVCLPQLRASGRSLSRPRKSEEGGRSSEGGAWGTVPLGPLGPLARDESGATAGSVCQAKRGWTGQGGDTGPGCPAPARPSQSPYLLPPHFLSHCLLYIIFSPLRVSLAASWCRCCCPCASFPELRGDPHGGTPFPVPWAQSLALLAPTPPRGLAYSCAPHALLCPASLPPPCALGREGPPSRGR